MVSGGKLLAASLALHGVRRVFTVAGESYLPVLDAFLDYPAIDVITCRHESGAAFMAEAHANLTGEVGIVFVTRGPGACNASIGIHTARQASTPVILFSGLINSADKGREAFQEFDLPKMFGPLAKWAADIPKIESIGEFVVRAFDVAQSGRPGPVVLGLPEDILFGSGEDKPVKKIPIKEMKPSDKDIAALVKFLNESQRPVIIPGGGGWSEQACKDLESFSNAAQIPVACAFRRMDLFNNTHGNYIGDLGFGPNPALVKRVKEADVILVLGARPDEPTTQSYTLFQPGQKIIHVYPSKEMFGVSCKADLTIEAHMAPTLAVLAKQKIDGKNRAAWRDAARKDYLAWSDIKEEHRAWKGADMTDVFRQLREVLPANAIITTDAGNFSGWAYRYLRYGRPGRLLGPISGAMGYGVPSAVAAALQYKDRIVLGICGDGGFMMTGHELATAMHHGAKPIILICNNSMYGTIRMHQERDYPGRISGTALTNPDFKALAESYGAFGARVDDANQFSDVWAKAQKSNKAALIEIRMDPRQITTNAKP